MARVPIHVVRQRRVVVGLFSLAAITAVPLLAAAALFFR